MATVFTKEYEAVQQKLGVSNVNAVPRLQRVVVHAGVGKNRDNKELLAAVQRDLKLITGQAPCERRARKAIAGFNVREGNLVGYQVTLRGKRMDDFTQRFVHVTLPRVRDFRGVKVSSLDGKGSLSVGVKEQLAFPEIHPEATDVVFGLEVTFVTTAATKAEGETLFRALGFPLTDDASADETFDIRQGKKN